jgi:hypothetical protein
LRALSPETSLTSKVDGENLAFNLLNIRFSPEMGPSGSSAEVFKDGELLALGLFEKYRSEIRKLFLGRPRRNEETDMGMNSVV